MSIIGFRSLLMLVSLLIFLVTFVAILFATWRHHQKQKSVGGNFHAALFVEMAWTVVPGLIVLVPLWSIARAI